MKTGGYVAPGFEAVADAFAANFRDRGELGAAFAAVRGDELVVDLWGGVADRPSGRPWQRNTLQLVFSGTKGMVALCMLMLIDRGRIALDDAVARHWPEFGKPEVAIRDLVGHTARLPGIDTPISVSDLVDDRRMAAILAAQAPSSDLRAAFCYHALTYGWLCGELIRRVDGRSAGTFFAEEVAAPLDVEFWIGLPEALEPRVSTLELDRDWGTTKPRTPGDFASDPLLKSVWGNPEIFDRATFFWNDRAVHGAEIPGANGIGAPRGIAKVYAALANGGAPLVSGDAMRLATTTLSKGYDVLHDEERRFGVGFQLQVGDNNYGPPPDAFGHGGAGGSIHGAWPTERVGFSYAMSLMRDAERPDPRQKALLVALHQAVNAGR